VVVSRDLANLGKSSSGIWPFSVSDLPGFDHSGKSSSGIRPILASQPPKLLGWEECSG
jgi:hypothetical protein